MQVDAEALLTNDPRPPVLYLRDFRNDEAAASHIPIDGIFTTEEERLAAVMNQVGPFVALGAPERKGVTDFGAARLYVSDEEWRAKVVELLRRARMVVIRIDPLREEWGSFFRDKYEHELIQKSSLKLNAKTRPDDFIPRAVGYGVWWELAQVKETISPERTLLYFPFKAKGSDREELYQDVRGLVESSLRRKLPPRLGRARFIGFETDGTAYLLDHGGPPTLGVVNLYGKTLKRFFKQLGANSVGEITVHYFGIVELLVGLVIALTVSIIAISVLVLIYRLIVQPVISLF